MQLTEPHYSVRYQEDLKLENYAISVAHLYPGNSFTLCPVPDPFVASPICSLHPCNNAFFLLKILQTKRKKKKPQIILTLGLPNEPHSLENTLELIFSASSVQRSRSPVTMLSMKMSLSF